MFYQKSILYLWTHFILFLVYTYLWFGGRFDLFNYIFFVWTLTLCLLVLTLYRTLLLNDRSTPKLNKWFAVGDSLWFYTLINKNYNKTLISSYCVIFVYQNVKHLVKVLISWSIPKVPFSKVFHEILFSFHFCHKKMSSQFLIIKVTLIKKCIIFSKSPVCNEQGVL